MIELEKFLKNGERAEWIEGYEGKYMITDHGRVISYRARIRQTKELKQHITTKGYYRVSLLTKEHKNKKFFVHALVARKFCDGYKDGLTVNHEDLDKSNNHHTNLEWVTHLENILHAIKNGACDGIYDHKMRPVTGTNIATQEKISFPSETATKNAGFDPAAVCLVVTGRQRSHKGYRWQYTKDQIDQPPTP